MEDDRFKIFVHRLKEGEKEVIEEIFDPQFLEVQEEELKLDSPVKVTGEAHVSGQTFYLTLAVQTQVLLPCVICSGPARVELKSAELTHTAKMEELKSGLFHMGEMIRQGILLEVPLAAECTSGSCPEREHIAKYFSKES